MLVLTRKVGEGITIGSDVRVVVIEVKAGQIRLGIEAPPTVQIHRDEVYARILEENKQAAGAQPRTLDALTQFNKPRRSITDRA